MRVTKLRISLLVFLVLVVAGVIVWSQSPLFWARYVNTFRSSGLGASSPVFDYRASIPPSSIMREIPTRTEPLLSDSVRADLIAYAQEFDSFALLVVHEGEIELEWYREDYGRESLTQSQSMHKSLQALLVGISLERGLIASIDDPITTYLPELSDSISPDTRIRDYLQMSTGLKPFEGGFSPFGEAFRWLYAEDIDQATGAIPQTGPPGMVFEYHDGATQTLGMLLTRVFGKPYTEYLHEYLWQPAGLGAAEVWLDSAEGTPHHNCCLLARAIDWAQLGLLVLNDGRVEERQVVSPSWVEEQISPNLTPHYGFQTWLASNAVPNPRQGGGGYGRSQDWLADDVVYFSGYGAQRVYISREKELVIVRLGPAAGYFPKIAEEWDNTWLFNTTVKGLQGET